MPHPLVWFLAGLTAPKLYEKLPDDQKEDWKKKYPIHHGEAGVLMMIGGALTKNHGLAAFGAGLMIEDWKDRSEWFHKDNEEDD